MNPKGIYEGFKSNQVDSGLKLKGNEALQLRPLDGIKRRREFDIEMILILGTSNPFLIQKLLFFDN